MKVLGVNLLYDGNVHAVATDATDAYLMLHFLSDALLSVMPENQPLLEQVILILQPVPCNLVQQNLCTKSRGPLELPLVFNKLFSF